MIEHVQPNEETVQVILDSLRGDPFSADLTKGLADSYYSLGDHFHANLAYTAYAKLVPNGPKGQRVERALKEMGQ